MRRWGGCEWGEGVHGGGRGVDLELGKDVNREGCDLHREGESRLWRGCEWGVEPEKSSPASGVALP